MSKLLVENYILRQLGEEVIKKNRDEDWSYRRRKADPIAEAERKLGNYDRSTHMGYVHDGLYVNLLEALENSNDRTHEVLGLLQQHMENQREDFSNWTGGIPKFARVKLQEFEDLKTKVGKQADEVEAKRAARGLA